MGVADGHTCLRLAAVLLLFRYAVFAPIDAAQSNAPTIDAHPMGAPVIAIIEFGEQYLGSELYNAKITVLAVVRGGKAWSIVQQASASNPPPKPGLDYLLAQVRVEFSSRTSPAHYNYNLNETQFTAAAPEGQEFDAPILDVPPKPRLSGTLKPGDTVEGWLVFLVPQKISRPVMVFREDVGIVSYRGGGTWFELYARPIPDQKPRL
ncbi:MAG TPA: DUF4352 domain-containing protein [Candidatus Acidoferrum sp.]|nr:DUF4352 domain-containing protein [Candidatus Acidoferrum sp.]